MRFALLGDHPDGLDVTRALVESGRYELAVYAGPPAGGKQLARWGLAPPRQGDLEEVLADPAIDAVIVATPLANRAAVLRRALQSERHVLCVHPADRTADIAFEAALLQRDTGCVLLPLLPEAVHPAVARFAELARAGDPPSLLEFERWTTDQPPEDHAEQTLPGWDVLRAVGGEIAEVFAISSGEEDTLPADVLLVSGRFVSRLPFRATYLCDRPERRWRLSVVGRAAMVLEFPDGWPGAARLTWTTDTGERAVEEWPSLNPWLELVEVFEDALVARGKLPLAALQWQDELRGLELDDALRRSITRGRSSSLDHQETTEEASFKGTMTLVGCALLWVTLVLLILAAFFPKLLWVIGPLFAVFLVLQTLRWVIPSRGATDRTSSNAHDGPPVR
jgi:predicted dehydrogenase